MIISRLKKAKRNYMEEGTSFFTSIMFFSGYLGLRHKLIFKKRKQEKAWSSPGCKKIAHITMYEVRNAGDNVLSECIRILFNRYFGELDWELVSLEEQVTDNTIEKLNNADLIVLGGHGAFIPDSKGKSNISGWKWKCPTDKYNMIKKPIIVFAVGYNYFNNIIRSKVFEENIAVLFNKAHFIGLRNNGSIDEVRAFLSDDIYKKIHYQPCPTTCARLFVDRIPRKKITKKIGFNVALDRIEQRLGEDYHDILREIAIAMHLIQKRGYEIHFFVHCEWEVQFFDYIRKEGVQVKYHHITAADTYNILCQYNEMDMVIGMRGHGIWIPFGVNCHILALGNQEKTRWFLEDINALDWMIDLSKEKEQLSDKIVDKFIEIHEKNGTTTSKRIEEAQKHIYKVTFNNLSIIGNIFFQDRFALN